MAAGAKFHNSDLIYKYLLGSDSPYFQKYSISIQNTSKEVRIDGLGSDQPINLAFGVQWGGLNATQGIQSAIQGVGNMLAGSKNATRASAGNLINSASALGGAGASLMKTAAGIGEQNVLDTIQKFEQAQSVTVAVDLFFMKEFIEDKSYKKVITDSLRISSPEFAASGMLIRAPLLYSPADKANNTDISSLDSYLDDCTVTIVIGNKMKIDRLLCDNFTFSASSQSRSDGSPLYIKCTYQFRTSRIMEYKEYAKWFEPIF
jgi:hypothetical protein